MTDCTPPAAPFAAHAVMVAEHTAMDPTTDWLWRRVGSLEDQRQMLHRERDEARARMVDLEAEIAALKALIRQMEQASR